MQEDTNKTSIFATPPVFAFEIGIYEGIEFTQGMCISENVGLTYSPGSSVQSPIELILY